MKDRIAWRKYALRCLRTALLVIAASINAEAVPPAQQGAIGEIDLASDTAWVLRCDDGLSRPIKVPGGGWNSDQQSPRIQGMQEVRDFVVYERKIIVPREASGQLPSLTLRVAGRFPKQRPKIHAYRSQLSVKHGPVTLLSVVETGSGGLKFLVAEGGSVPGPILEIGNTTAVTSSASARGVSSTIGMHTAPRTIARSASVTSRTRSRSLESCSAWKRRRFADPIGVSRD